jgi:hypothetical protein
MLFHSVGWMVGLGMFVLVFCYFLLVFKRSKSWMILKVRN